MNSFGQNTVELFLIWSLEDCHLILFFYLQQYKEWKNWLQNCWARISAITKQLTEQFGNDSV